jgi:hypothetical protein
LRGKLNRSCNLAAPIDPTDTATSWRIPDDGLRGCAKDGVNSLLKIEEESDPFSDVQVIWERG